MNERPTGESAMPLLAPYVRTRPGFEICTGAASEGLGPGFRDLGEGWGEFCLWNIFQRKGDPAEQDAEKAALNELQRTLGALSNEERYVRIQVACLNRCYWTFPANVDLVLGSIAAGGPDLTAGISCEPPWTALRQMILERRNPAASADWPVVRYQHHQQGIDPRCDARQQLLRAYMTILTWWTVQGHPECLKAELPAHAELVETIYRRLGGPDRLKQLYVQKLLWNLSRDAIPRQRTDAGGQGLLEPWSFFDDAIRAELGGREDVVGRLIAQNNDKGTCHHAFIRHIDHQIATIGAGGPVLLPGTGEERQRVIGALVNYTHALGSWLMGREEAEAVSEWPASADRVGQVYATLGTATARKRWLAGCLWKKLREVQARAGRGALDEDPQRFAVPLRALQP